MINEIMLKGEIVPIGITVKLIKTAMERAGWASKKFLIDGFPRNEDNQQGWVEHMEDAVNMEAVIFLDCTEEDMVKRIEQRAKDAGD